MKKRLFTLALMLCAASGLMAQVASLPSFAMEANYNDRFFFGLKGGVNCPRLYYTNPNVSDLPHDAVIGVSAGVFAEFPFSDWLALAPELNYQQRGGSTTYVYEQDYQVNYSLKANYASVRLPLFGYLPVFTNLRPYLMLGPDVGYVVNGNISLTQPGLDIQESHVSLNKSNMEYLYVGILGGAGVRYNLVFSGVTLVIKADAAVNFGFMDTFAKSEHSETATSTNIHAYNHQGKRISQGVEFHLSIGYIPEKKDDVCDHFSLFRGKRVKTIW